MVHSGNADLIGRVLHGRYRLLEPIGRGSSGQVYAAQDTQLQRRVAVKILHQALASDAGFLRRFQIEAQVAASLSHPNIISTYSHELQSVGESNVQELCTWKLLLIQVRTPRWAQTAFASLILGLVPRRTQNVS